MGNIATLVKESKSFLKEFPRILGIAVDILFGITSILEDIENVFIDLKEIMELLQLIQMKSEIDEELSEKAKGLIKEAKLKLSKAKILGQEERKSLENIQTVVSELVDMKSRQFHQDPSLD